MRISYNWLKDLIDHGLSVDETARKLTNVGLAVDSVEDLGHDSVFDIDLTSNRPDCLSHLGVARELSAITGRSVSWPSPNRIGGGVEPNFLVMVESPDVCRRFTARIIRGVKIGPSPQWMVDRLNAIGERSINNVADITNYVMHESGQPMHAFDLDKLAERRIVVRDSRAGESVVTLDGEKRELVPGILSICDAERPVSVAGIMGGLESSIGDDTVNVLLEVAHFDRSSIRRTSRTLNLATEASYRFERGVDIENVIPASDRAAQLIVDLAGGEIQEFADVYSSPRLPCYVASMDIAAAVGRLTGFSVETAKAVKILNSLGISGPENNGAYTVPSWRHDIAIEEDLVEEVSRHLGYENLGSEIPPAFGAGAYQPHEKDEMSIRETLTVLGFSEAISYSFIDVSHDGLFDLAPGVQASAALSGFVTLCDAVIEGATRMRPTILPGLLDAVRLNFNHQRRNVMLFEIGRAFSRSADRKLPSEAKLLTLVLTGSAMSESRSLAGRQLDLYDAKGAVEAALAAIGVDGLDSKAVEIRHLRPGQAGSVIIDSATVGYFGRLSDDLSVSYKFRPPVFVAEVNLDVIFAQKVLRPVYRPLPRFPGIERDISLVGDRSITFSAIKREIAAQNLDLCRSVEFVDIFEGGDLGDDQRSITLRIDYRSDDRTLSEAEIEPVHQLIVRTLERDLGLAIRQ